MKAGWKLNIKKTKIMAFSPITSWQIEGERVEVLTDFLFLGFQITVNGDCGHEIRRWLHLSRKAKTNLDSVLKSRDITLLTKVCMIKAMIFPVVTYGYESWTVKKAEHIRIDAFELVELEDSYESLGQWDQTSQSYRTSTLNIHWKDWCWSWNSIILVTWC